MNVREIQAAYDTHKDEAVSAYALFVAHCDGIKPPRIPGMDTIIRLACRIALGRSIEEAAAREYIYRWSLAIKAPDQCLHNSTRNPCVSVFGTPHAIGL